MLCLLLAACAKFGTAAGERDGGESEHPDDGSAGGGGPGPDGGNQASGTDASIPPDCSGAPVSPETMQPVCPPYQRPAVFFVPGPDIETLFMGGAILSAAVAGRPVFVEFMAHGERTGVRTILANGGTDSWHSGSHVYTLSTDEVGDERVREGLDAAGRLGVTGVHVSDFGDTDTTIEEVTSRVDWWLQTSTTELILAGSARPPSDDQAVWSALLASGHEEIRGYTDASGAYSAVVDISGVCAAKSAALDAYQIWSPQDAKYAIGYHSVRSLFDQVRADCHEYVVLP